jgi:hypothetical protein
MFRMTSRQRWQTVLAGKIPDCVPVAPDFLCGGRFDANMKPAKTGVILVLKVADIPKTLAAIKKAGGWVTRDKTPIYGGKMGYDAYFRDPTRTVRDQRALRFADRTIGRFPVSLPTTPGPLPLRARSSREPLLASTADAALPSAARQRRCAPAPFRYTLLSASAPLPPLADTQTEAPLVAIATVPPSFMLRMVLLMTGRRRESSPRTPLRLTKAPATFV